MLLIPPEIWAEKYFAPEARPCKASVLRWLRSGKVEGRKVGGCWYVDEHAWLAGGDDLVQRVLEAG